MNTFYLSSSGAQKSLLEELWDYFARNYLDSSAAYENINLGNSMISLTSILLGLSIGLILACIAVVYDKRVLGDFVRKIISEGALTKEKATTLYHLGYNERSTVAKALRHNIGLRKIVVCVEEQEHIDQLKKAEEEYEKRRTDDPSLPPFKAAEFRFDNTSHFYIPKEKRITAEIKFARGGAAWWNVPLVIIGATIGFFVLLLVIPYMMTLLDQLIGSFKSM